MDMRVSQRRLALTVLGVVCLSALAAPAHAQSRGWGGEEQMRTRMKELMAATDEEWQVLAPKIERVQQTQRATSMGRAVMSMMFGRGGNNFGGRSGRGEGSRGSDGSTGQPPQVAPVEQKATELKAVLDRKDAGAEELKTMLTALREARAAAKAEHARAQEELRELLTVRQETVLVIMGLLE